MNKKIYLSALVLPAVFTACTQDELVDLNNKVQNRVVLEDLTFAEGVESRLAFEGSSFNSLTFQNGDGIGAYLMDSPKDILTDEELAALRLSAENDYQIEKGLKDGYELTSNIQGSHKFVYDEAANAWTTLDKMVEGSYIYVLPYQEKSTREAITTALPQIQYLKYKEGTNELDDKSLMTQLIESGQPLAVGYEFLSRYNSEVAGSMKQIYAYPNITFTNEFEESVTIQKIVINNKKKFALKGTLDLKKAEAELRNYDSDPKANDLKNSTVAGNWTKAVNGNYYKAENYTADIVTPITDSNVDFIVVVAPENLTVASEASISFQAVIPAASYSKDDITIDVYTNKGVFQQKLDAVKFNNGLRYSATNYSEGSLKANTAADKYGNGAFTRGADMTVAQEDIKKLDQVVVIDTNDLLAVINGEVEGTEVKPNMIKVAPLSEVAINEDVVSALGTKKGLEVTEEVEIHGNENGLVVKNIDFLGNEATVTEGVVSFKNVTMASLAIEAGATVNVDRDFGANTDITNEGTLNISSYNQNGTVKETTLGTVNNFGVMNVGTKLTATIVRNGADVATPAYNEVVTTAEINALANITSTVDNYGAFNVKNSIAVTTTNNKKVTKTDCVDKIGSLTVDAGKLFTTGGSNNGTMTVNGEFRATTAFDNNGTIYNNYGMENKAGVELDNFGTIKVAANAKYTSVNNNEGTIEIENRQSEIRADVNLGTIQYNAEAGNTFVVLPTDKFNTVKFSEGTTLTVKTAGSKNEPVEGVVDLAKKLTVIAAAEGNYSFSQDVASIAGFKVEKNIYATIISNVTITESVTIGEGATFHLGTGNTLTYNKSENFVNNGTFRNMGILNAMCVEPQKGTWTGSGLYSWGNVNKGATATLQAKINKAITEGGTVVLNETVILSEPLVFEPATKALTTKKVTLNLNGKKLSNEKGNVIVVKEGVELTIEGNGIVYGSESNGFGSNAVIANGGKVVIKNGTFKVGGDNSKPEAQLYKGNFRNDCIYAINGGHITIEGGHFEYTGKRVIGNGNEYQDDGRYFLLNKKDNSGSSITVKAGTFIDFNPAYNIAEPTEPNDLVDSNSAVSKVEQLEADGTWKNITGSILNGVAFEAQAFGKTWTQSKKYTVSVK